MLLKNGQLLGMPLTNTNILAILGDTGEPVNFR